MRSHSMRAANHAALYFKRRAGNRVRPTLPRAPPCLVRPTLPPPPCALPRSSLQAFSQRSPPCVMRAAFMQRACAEMAQRCGGGRGIMEEARCRVQADAPRRSPFAVVPQLELGIGVRPSRTWRKFALHFVHVSFHVAQSQATGCKFSSNEAQAPAHSSAIHKTALTTAPDDCTAAVTTPPVLGAPPLLQPFF